MCDYDFYVWGMVGRGEADVYALPSRCIDEEPMVSARAWEWVWGQSLGYSEKWRRVDWVWHRGFGVHHYGFWVRRHYGWVHWRVC